MEAKYYTPKIEDLHHNFECEVFFENKWNSCIIQNHEGDFCVMKGFPNKLVKFLITEKTIEDKNIRVKYLDREDIESLGWVKSYDRNDLFFFNQEQFYMFIQRDFKINIVNMHTIAKKELFYGYLKNKLELQKLMQQLEILDK